MQLNKTNFRDLDRKWIVFDREKEIKKIYKKKKQKYEKGILLTYAFISHEDGIQFRLLGHIIEENGILYLEEETINKNLTFSYEHTQTYHITSIEDSVIKKIIGTSEIEKEYDAFYLKNSILESRKITEIDAFRHEEYIDDVELLYENGKEKEYFWARIEDCSKKNLLFVCSLLEASKKNKNYKEGTLVLAKLEQRKKEVVFITDGIVDKVQK